MGGKTNIDKAYEKYNETKDVDNALAYVDTFIKADNKHRYVESHFEALQQILRNHNHKKINSLLKANLPASLCDFLLLTDVKFESSSVRALDILRIIGISKSAVSLAKENLAQDESTDEKKLLSVFICQIYRQKPIRETGQRTLSFNPAPVELEPVPEDLPNTFIHLLTQYLSSESFAEDAGGLGQLLALSNKIGFPRGELSQLVDAEIRNDECKNPTSLLLWRAENIETIDDRIHFLNQHEPFIKKDCLPRFLETVAALGLEASQLTGKFSRVAWNNLAYVKEIIAGFDEKKSTTANREQFESAIYALGELIKKSLDDDLGKYALGLAEKYLPAYEILKELIKYFGSKQTNKKIEKTFVSAAKKTVKENDKKFASQEKEWALTRGERALARNNLVLARRYFRFSAEKEEKKSYPFYASMCFLGQGDTVCISEAFQYAEKCTIRDPAADQLLTFGEIYHVMSMHNSGEEKTRLVTKATQYYEAVIESETLPEKTKTQAGLNRKALGRSAITTPVAMEISDDNDYSDDSDQEEERIFKDRLEKHIPRQFDIKLERQIEKVAKETTLILAGLQSMERDASPSGAQQHRVSAAFAKEVAGFHFNSSTAKNGTALKAATALTQGIESSKAKDGIDRNLAAKLAEMEQDTQEEYYLSVMRGNHFDRDRWTPGTRRTHRAMVQKGEGSVFPAYASAVYVHAGVRYADFSELTQRRLALSEKYIQYRMEKLNDEPYKEGDLPLANLDITSEEKDSLYKILFNREFKSKREQIQHLYSNHYGLFHKFIAWESTLSEAVFPNKGSPFVSSADYGSMAAQEYAIGNKYYAGTEGSRLKPNFDNAGKPLKSKTGVVSLHLLSIADLLQPHTHAVSMTRDGEIQVDNRVLPERETTFIGVMPGKLTFQYIAKFPDFSVEYHQGVFLKYGLSETLFEAFKKALLKFPHDSSAKQLVIRLLGRHLSAFNALHMQYTALDTVRRKTHNAFLFFRSAHGGLSTTATSNEDNNPFLNGSKTESRRHTSALAHEKRRREPVEINSETSNDDTFSRKRKKGKGPATPLRANSGKRSSDDDSDTDASLEKNGLRKRQKISDSDEDAGPSGVGEETASTVASPSLK
ncbi:MAG: hypothetical protein DHS20C10_01650 [marine bacterium B5-7]|nr:MAG: hypothetical protein DHS20C10_01650 [marine bacterium B5-7]